MLHIDLCDVAVEPHQPKVLHTASEGRAIAIHLPAGEELQDHEVHERAYLSVISGAVEVATRDGEAVRAEAGALFIFDPKERHEVKALDDARLLLVLTPWPGEGHPSQGH